MNHTCDPFHATKSEVAACPGCQAGDTYEGWRAQAEALAGALRELQARYCVVTGGDLHGGYCLQHDYLPTSHDPYCEDAARALARLPAQALAERRQLEEDLAVAHQIGDSFWAALKPLQLKHIYVENPGHHVTDLIRQRDAALAERRTLQENALIIWRVLEDVDAGRREGGA